MKKLLSYLAIATFAAVVFAGCNKQDTASTTEAATNNVVTNNTATNTP